MAGQRIPSAQELTAALEMVHSRLMKVEQKEQEKPMPATQETVNQFFLPRTVKKEEPVVKNEPGGNPETLSLDALRLLLQNKENEAAAQQEVPQPAPSITAEMLQNLCSRLGQGTTSSGSGGTSAGAMPLNVVPNQGGGVTLSTEQYYALLSAVKGKKKKVFPPRASSRGNLYYILKDGMKDNGHADIVMGWENAELRFGSGRTWDLGKNEHGRLVEGYRTWDEALARWHEIYPQRTSIGFHI